MKAAPWDEGLNYVVVGKERFTLAQAVEDTGATLVGRAIWKPAAEKGRSALWRRNSEGIRQRQKNFANYCNNNVRFFDCQNSQRRDGHS